MMPKNRILVVDDERDILQFVSYNLKKEGYLVDEALTGNDALCMVSERLYQLILLDLMLPGLSGIKLCQIFKKDPNIAHVPIIMLTARTGEMDKVLGLETGADDYVTKPFSVRELMARVKTVLRRAGGGVNAKEVLRAGDLEVDQERHLVSVGEKTIDVSPTEFRLLQFLLEKKGMVFSRERILEAVWKSESCIELRTVDVHIRRLRAELEKVGARDFIRTVHGVGYSFSDK